MVASGRLVCLTTVRKLHEMDSTDYKEKLEEEGMAVYQHIVDNCETCAEQLPELIERMHNVDMSGQFMASTARYLAAVDRIKFEPYLGQLIEGAIEKDREHKYIGSLLQSIWGEDYQDHIDQLKKSDDNFRRIYKRMHPEENVM